MGSWVEKVLTQIEHTVPGCPGWETCSYILGTLLPRKTYENTSRYATTSLHNVRYNAEKLGLKQFK